MFTFRKEEKENSKQFNRIERRKEKNVDLHRKEKEKEKGKIIV